MNDESEVECGPATQEGVRGSRWWYEKERKLDWRKKERKVE
jgi:hypothetical protein